MLAYVHVCVQEMAYVGVVRRVGVPTGGKVGKIGGNNVKQTTCVLIIELTSKTKKNTFHTSFVCCGVKERTKTCLLGRGVEKCIGDQWVPIGIGGVAYRYWYGCRLSYRKSNPTSTYSFSSFRNDFHSLTSTTDAQIQQIQGTNVRM